MKARTFQKAFKELFEQKTAIKPIKDWVGSDFSMSRCERRLSKNRYKQELRGNNPSV